VFLSFLFFGKKKRGNFERKYIYIFRLRNGRETLEEKKEQRIYIHANIAHARAVAIEQRPLPCFFTEGDPKKTS
jgi:hypothetical protein